MLSPRVYRFGFYAAAAVVVAALGITFAARAGYRLARMMMDAATGARGSSNMPVGVGGGAMSIHGASPVGVVHLPGGDVPCLILEPGLIYGITRKTEIELDGVTASPIPSPKAPGTVVSTYVKPPWKMDLYARLRDGSPSTTDGLHVESTHDCMLQSGGAKHGVVVTAFGSMSKVYPYGDFTTVMLDEDALIRRRYEHIDPRYENPDLRPTNIGPACTSTPDATGDEDVCEHMSTITIKEGTNAPKSYNCTSGECTIGIEE